LKLDSQHRLAAKILKVGLSRVKIDPERAEDVELAIYARISRKELWMRKIRALRKELQRLKQKRLVAKKTYVRLYRLASSGVFESVSDMHRYIETKGLWRRR